MAKLPPALDAAISFLSRAGDHDEKEILQNAETLLRAHFEGQVEIIALLESIRDKKGS